MMDFKNIKNWIFDLDGTLTVKVHDFVDIRKRLGVPLSEDIITYLATVSEKERRRCYQLLDEIEKEVAELSCPAEGAPELITFLSSQSCNLGILTRNTRENAIISLKKIGLKKFFPDHLIMGRDDVLPKPEPDGILHFLCLWNSLPQHTVMAGDYLHDLRSGRAAGTYTVYVDPEGVFPYQEYADVKVASLMDLMGMMAIDN